MKALIAGISVLALAATPALAQGNGNGNGNRGNHAAQSDNRGNGNGNANRGNQGNSRRDAAPQQQRGNDRGGPPAIRSNNGNGNGNANGNRSAAPIRIDTRGNGNNGNRGNGNGNGNGNRNGDDLRVVINPGGLVDYGEYRTGIRNVADGCPPGLARKYNGCMPPGLARQQDSNDYRRYAPDWWGYDGWGRGGSYYYDDGFLLRIGDGGSISGYIPLLGGALSIGNPWPEDYRYSRMPGYYESFYDLGRPDYYRYSDNVVYRLDPETTAIASIAALLTGTDFMVGQPMPRGYDVYNVPYSYRDRYHDRPDAMYRYNNGYVYQIDPETMLVASAIELVL